MLEVGYLKLSLTLFIELTIRKEKIEYTILMMCLSNHIEETQCLIISG